MCMENKSARERDIDTKKDNFEYFFMDLAESFKLVVITHI